MFTSSSIQFHAPIIHHRLSSTTTHSFLRPPPLLNPSPPSIFTLRPPPLLSPSPPSIFTVSAKPPTPDKASEQKWVHEGLITESLPNGMFRVLLDNQDLILGYISGKIRKNYVRILPGDRVRVEVSRYDSSKGRIIYRIRSTPGGAAGKSS
ncbi:unnamed protein product [Vicia faba]|uniref:Translation initiation factor IF-1, chloroplastic n=1 Tax=Vicia faba TaxID=3906 RepID=A0AAV1AD31_VICFA|nr:unnamed protein product [Vicia faba]